MSKANDLLGKRFGKLTVVLRAGSDKKGNSLWKCRCDCGKEVISVSYLLTGGKKTHCGCDTSRLISRKIRKHGESQTRLYHIWVAMKGRCFNKNSSRYSDYGGRGITVCLDWRKSYEAFRDWALSNGYEDNLTIDRIDNDGHYEPGNCRWITRKEQNSNKQQYRRRGQP